MAEELKKLSNSELEFMEFIWSSSGDKSLQDFIVHFADKHWERPTVSVFLHRLTQKKYLTYYQKGRHYYYRPLITKLEYEQGKINKSIRKLFGTSLEGVIASFCGKKKLDQTQIDRIREFLDELENEKEN